MLNLITDESLIKDLEDKNGGFLERSFSFSKKKE